MLILEAALGSISNILTHSHTGSLLCGGWMPLEHLLSLKGPASSIKVLSTPPDTQQDTKSLAEWLHSGKGYQPAFPFLLILEVTVYSLLNVSVRTRCSHSNPSIALAVKCHTVTDGYWDSVRVTYSFKAVAQLPRRAEM